MVNLNLGNLIAWELQGVQDKQFELSLLVPRLYNFFMLSSAETKICPVGILTFLSRINYKLWSSKPSVAIYLDYFSIYEELKFQAQLS